MRQRSEAPPHEACWGPDSYSRNWTMLLLAVVTIVAPMVITSCTLKDASDDKPKVNSAAVDSIQDLSACVKRYWVSFEDSFKGDWSPSFSYRASIEAGSGWGVGRIVAVGSAVTLTPPFTDGRVTVDLGASGGVEQGDYLSLCVEAASGGQFGPESLSRSCVNLGRFWGFPDECYMGINLTADGLYIYDGECIFIAGDNWPRVPTLQASLQSNTLEDDVNWDLIISYTRSGRRDFDTVKASLSPHNTWYIDLAGKVRGGQARLRCRSRETGAAGILDFAIRAYNPSEQLVNDYISGRPGVLWYHKLVAMQEGGIDNGNYLQFNEAGEESCEATAVRYTPNASNNNDGGFGIYQLTWFNDGYETRRPNAEELWNWQENVKSGVACLNLKQGEADAYMDAQKAIGRATYEPLPDWGVNYMHTTGAYNNVTFMYNTDKDLQHAEAMKRYNGLGRPLHHYAVFDTDLKDWVFWEWARYTNDDDEPDSNRYVYDVCSRYF